LCGRGLILISRPSMRRMWLGLWRMRPKVKHKVPKVAQVPQRCLGQFLRENSCKCLKAIELPGDLTLERDLV
jgi:hypothetical protein